jgi:hypothetical protein
MMQPTQPFVRSTETALTMGSWGLPNISANLRFGIQGEGILWL